MSVHEQKRGLGRGLGSLLGNTEDIIEKTEKVESKDLNNQIGSLPSHDFVEDDDFAVIEPGKVNSQPLNTQISNETEAVLDSQRIYNLAIDKILPNSEQPRREFDKSKLSDLANSIKEKGVLQPIVVRRRSENVFELIAGERRWRATQLAGLHEIPAIVREAEDQESLELALIENIQRHDLNPIDEAEAFERLHSEYNLTQNEISAKVGKDRTTVANSLRLLSLTVDVRNMLVSGELSVGHAKALLAITDPVLQKKLARKITSQKLTVRAAEKLVKVKDESNTNPTVEDKLAVSLAEDLQKTLGRKVKIDYNDGKGKISIFYYSNDELNEISERMKDAWNN